MVTSINMSTKYLSKLLLNPSQVYGIEWKTGPSAYSVYTSFKNTPRQRTEMLESHSIKGLEQCHIGS